MAKNTKAYTFKTGQLVRITDYRNLAYGRIAMVMTAKDKGRSLVRFADLPKPVSAHLDPTGLTAIFRNAELTLISDIPITKLYVLITIVERIGDRRHVCQCLAHSHQAEQQLLANEVAQCWHSGGGGTWDEDESVYRFTSEHFVFAEDWRELSLAEYINLRSVLTDCTPTYAGSHSYGEDTEAEYIRLQTRGL